MPNTLDMLAIGWPRHPVSLLEQTNILHGGLLEVTASTSLVKQEGEASREGLAHLLALEVVPNSRNDLKLVANGAPVKLETG